MIAHQTIPFPELVGDNATDIKNLHEYTFKFQSMLIYMLSNLTLNNFNSEALGRCEIRTLADGGMWVGSKLENEKPNKKSFGIVIYPDKAPKKCINGVFQNL